MFNISADGLKWLIDHLRPRWFWGLVAILSVVFSVWSTIPDKYRARIIDYVASGKWENRQGTADLRVADFEIEGAIGRIPRLAEGQRSSATWSSCMPRMANASPIACRRPSPLSRRTRLCNGSVSTATADEAEINVRVVQCRRCRHCLRIVHCTARLSEGELQGHSGNAGLRARYRHGNIGSHCRLEGPADESLSWPMHNSPRRSRKAAQQKLEEALKLLDAAVAHRSSVCQRTLGGRRDPAQNGRRRPREGARGTRQRDQSRSPENSDSGRGFQSCAGRRCRPCGRALAQQVLPGFETKSAEAYRATI